LALKNGYNLDGIEAMRNSSEIEREARVSYEKFITNK